jgi:HSP20 family molecular chaperone IbpA
MRKIVLTSVTDPKGDESMAEQTVAMTTSQHKGVAREGTRTQERYITPAVDIYETPEGLTVVADLPGVMQDTLEVRVDHNVLTLRGMSHHVAPGDVVYREYELVNFFRQFELGEKIDQSHIAAALKQGVLTVHLPKAPEAQPRKIAVSVA